MKEKSPAFQWYPKDILSSKRVALMSLQEEGAYRRAIDYCWLHGSLPADLKQLALIIGKGCSGKIATRVKAMFIEENGELRHERLDQERCKQQEFGDRQKERADKRWHQTRNAEKDAAIDAAALSRHEKPQCGNGCGKDALHLHSSFASALNTNTSSTITYAHEDFLKKFFSEEGGLDREKMAMSVMPRRNISAAEAQEFEAHLHLENKRHENYHEWLKHFRNWLNTRPREQKALFPQGKTTASGKAGQFSDPKKYENSKADLG